MKDDPTFEDWLFKQSTDPSAALWPVLATVLARVDVAPPRTVTSSWFIEQLRNESTKMLTNNLALAQLSTDQRRAVRKNIRELLRYLKIDVEMWSGILRKGQRS